MNSEATIELAHDLSTQALSVLEKEIRETKQVQEKLAQEIERLTSANNTSQELIAVLRAENQQQRAELDKLQTKEPCEQNI